MKVAVLLLLTACGGSSALDTTSPPDVPDVDAAIVCNLGAHGGEVACDPNDPWWWVASSDGHEDTFATCAHATCPRTVGCFVGGVEGYCR